MTVAPSWRTLSPSLRALGLWVTIVQVVGYTTSLLFIHHTTGMTPPGVAEQYRGGDSTAVTSAAMKFPNSMTRTSASGARAEAMVRSCAGDGRLTTGA